MGVPEWKVIEASWSKKEVNHAQCLPMQRKAGAVCAWHDLGFCSEQRIDTNILVDVSVLCMC